MAQTETTRRSFLTVLAATVPALVLAPKAAQALAPAGSQDVGFVPATGVWGILAHVTDGTDPSTATVAPPTFTADMHKLSGTEIVLTGYVQPVTGGFGVAREYLLSRGTFHCPYCYALGRGSLVLASFGQHVPLGSAKKVTVRGQLALQEKDPADFYFQLKNAKIVV